MTPHDDLTIRPARPEDERGLAELNRAAWSTLSDVSPEPSAEDGIFDERHTPDQYLLAVLDGRIVGYVRQVPATPLAANRHVRQIQGLAVDDSVRGRGIGRRLVEAACAAARAGGARKLGLRVLGWNTPARRLYESCGFVVEGSLAEEFLIDGRYVDDIWMARRLTD
ncbi:GNAT family N-acetyltransferase [Kitasatospora aureofaciens]|uniref:N-acetyltransferase n=1 Tax=Kitasatospora aureofaciens TaxID=1894 RepID=A0A1E7MZC5_KITAU|nr:GNAT family N-acetyltransferase [Kitasatospora aureofaciens]QEV01930.1 GNAT family N-acetyltransferase [Streptomyces viridifaciens]ARF80678.1 N-acetyltransferase [Kitasatospora aureofaciens]OEV33573.1 GNAT family N-acetyltransferase [Kitasatospora aureofaciens]UKZ08393.1 GNAT family N-acetyltransferase [Streptomyces viridifaciens]GGU61084.1 N-acetyltransferase [Kitasatospora aureofaciens]